MGERLHWLEKHQRGQLGELNRLGVWGFRSQQVGPGIDDREHLLDHTKIPPWPLEAMR